MNTRRTPSARKALELALLLSLLFVGALLWFGSETALPGSSAGSGRKAGVPETAGPDDELRGVLDSRASRDASISTPSEPEARAANGPTEKPEQEPPLPEGVAGLELRILSPDPNWGVSLSGDTPAFLVSGKPSWLARPTEGVRSSTDEDETGKGQTYFRGGPRNTYSFTSVRPYVPLTAEVVDGFDLPVSRVNVAALVPGERRVVELEVPATLRTLEGRVLSPEGDPVKRALVSVGAPGAGKLTGRETDDDGRFALERIGPEEVVLRIKAEGFVEFIEPNLRVPDGRLEFTLDRGRTVRVLVRDPDLRRAPGATVIGNSLGVDLLGVVSRTTDENGVCVLEGVPSGDLSLTVTMGGRTFGSTVPSGALEHVVEIPAWRRFSLRIVGQRPPSDSTPDRVRMRLLTPAAERAETAFLPPGVDEAVFEQLYPGTYEARIERFEGLELTWSAGPIEIQVPSTGDEVADFILR